MEYLHSSIIIFIKIVQLNPMLVRDFLLFPRMQRYNKAEINFDCRFSTLCLLLHFADLYFVKVLGRTLPLHGHGGGGIPCRKQGGSGGGSFGRYSDSSAIKRASNGSGNSTSIELSVEVRKFASRIRF